MRQASGFPNHLNKADIMKRHLDANGLQIREILQWAGLV